MDPSRDTSNQIDRDRRRCRVVVSSGELVDDGGHASRSVLRGLRVFGGFGRD